jgi:hypothetical protein
MHIDPKLKEHATERQCAYIDAVNAHGSIRAAALALGVNNTSVLRSLKSLKGYAAWKGNAPGKDALDGRLSEVETLKGRSMLIDTESGKSKYVWLKTDVKAEAVQAMMREVCDAMCEELPRVAPQPSPSSAFFDELCNVYTLTDCHVGMLSWGKETGEPWDLKIAEQTLVQSFEHMVNNSPPARVALVNQLGDFLHYDSMLPVTPQHGHILDADGRFSKMVEVAIRILRQVVNFALARHDRVVLLLAEGNHDMASSVWLRHMFRALYENEPRVTVIDSELPYYAHQHGQTMLGFHHGHIKKLENLPLLFAAQFAAMWGATTKRYAHVGHRHHKDEKEHEGMTVFQHETIAARDAHSARHGWVSGRSVTSVTYHSEFGEVARNTVTPEMLAT